MKKEFLENLVELASKKKGKRPCHISIFSIEQSPVYKHPEKWSKRYCIMPHSNKIDTYKPLNKSIYGMLFAESPRMTYLSRIVVPKSFLIPMTLYKNNIQTNQQSKSASRFLLGPLITKKHSEEDPILYYPKSQKLFEHIGRASGKEEISKVPKIFFRVSSNEYITENMDVGWARNTTRVMERLFAQEVDTNVGGLAENDTFTNNKDSFIVLNFTDTDESMHIDWVSNQIIIKVKSLLADYPTIFAKLRKLFDESSKEPHVTSGKSNDAYNLLLALYKFTLFKDS